MLTAQHILDASYGPAYLVDEAGRIMLVGQRHWNAHVGNAPGQPDPGSLPGRNLFEFICGAEVQALYRRAIARLCAGREQVIELDYRCDSPDLKRALRMTATAVPGAEANFILFFSRILSQAQRPRLSLFEYGKLVSSTDDRPVLMICSMCHRILTKIESQHEALRWLEPEEYYRAGGTGDVSLSHGLCPSCFVASMDEAGIAAPKSIA